MQTFSRPCNRSPVPLHPVYRNHWISVNLSFLGNQDFSLIAGNLTKPSNFILLFHASALIALGLTKTLNFIRPFLASAIETSFHCSRLIENVEKSEHAVRKKYSQSVGKVKKTFPPYGSPYSNFVKFQTSIFKFLRAAPPLRRRRFALAASDCRFAGTRVRIKETKESKN